MASGPDRLADHLLPAIRGWLAEHRGLFVLGICGAQGSGKSTLVAALAERLTREGIRVATLSLDDLYLTRAARQELARDIHPLFATRGVPGTHDVPLGLATLDALARGESVALPRFDKAADDRAPEALWPRVQEDTQVLLFEGWCLGAAPQPESDLAVPVNALEAEEDPETIWRRHANAALAHAYKPLWDRIDRLVLLAAPGFEVVAKWREQAEAELRAHGGAALMDPAGIARFIEHYERLTRWILKEMPNRTDLVVRLGQGREVL